MHHVIGPSGRARLRKSQPFTALMLEVAFALSENEVSALKLALRCDGLSTKKSLYLMKNAHDVLHRMRDLDLVSEHNTDYLEHLLCHCGRQDLVQEITKYHTNLSERRVLTEQTTVKQRLSGSGSFTKLKSYLTHEVTSESRGEPSGASLAMTRSCVAPKHPTDAWMYMEHFESSLDHMQLPKEIAREAAENPNQPTCSVRDYSTSPKRLGLPTVGKRNQLDGPGNILEASVSDEKKEVVCEYPCSSQESQMSVDCTEKCSQMSISDDEKLEFLQDSCSA